MRIPKDNVETILLFNTNCQSWKRGVGGNSAKYLQNFTKSVSGHLHLGYNLYAKYHDIARVGLQILCLGCP